MVTCPLPPTCRSDHRLSIKDDTVKYFKDIEGMRLTFTTAVRPFKRCLAFQATQAIKQAITEGRIRENWCADKNFKTHSPAATNIAVRSG